MKGKKEGAVPQNTFIDVIIRKLENQKKKFLVANAVHDEIPIIYCNDNFCNLSGYNRGDVIRRSAYLDFLYGPLTSPKSIRDIKNALHDTKEKNISVLFYRKNGGHFRCNMVIAPVRNESGNIRLFVLNLHVATDDKHRPLLGSKAFGGIKIPIRSSTSGSITGGGQPFSNFTANLRHRGERAGHKALNESLLPGDMDNNQMDLDDDEESINENGVSWLRNISKFIHHGTLLSVLVKGSTAIPTSGNQTITSAGIFSHPGLRSKDALLNDKRTSDIEKTSVYAASPDSIELFKSVSSGDSDTSMNGPRDLNPARLSNYRRIQKQISSTESDIYKIDETKTLKRNPGHSSDSQASAKYDPLQVDHHDVKSRRTMHPNQAKHIPDKFAKMLSTEEEKSIKSRRTDFKIPFCTFRHDGLGKNIWDWFVLALVVYTAVFTPYSASFLSQELLENNGMNSTLVGLSPSAGLYHRKTYTQSKLTIFNIIDYLIDISFILDVFINFRTTYVNRSDDLIMKPGSIAVHYFKGWFLIDVISAVPFDFLLFFAESNEVISLMSLLKIARLLRLIRVVKKMNKYTENEAAFLLFLMTTFSLIAHWLACFWYAIGNSERKNGHPFNWLEVLAQETEQDYAKGGPTTKSKYITALYFTFSSLTSVGFGNVSPNTESEKVFSICVMLIGSLMYAGIFGHVSAIIQRLYSGTARYHTQMMRVKEFIRFHQIPNPLRQRLEEYFQHNWACTNGIEMSNVLHSFPEGIQADICLHLNQNLLSTNPAFKNGSEGYLRTLSLKFETTHVPPGDTLIHSGDLLSDLYFIARGSVEILSRDNTTLAILCQGDIFGEHPCLNKMIGKSKCNVRAMTYCDLHKINRRKILETLQMYPEFAQTFTDGLRITFDLRDEVLSIALKSTEIPEKPALVKSLSINNQTINKTQFNNIYKIINREERKRPTEIPLTIMNRISTLENDVMSLDRRVSESLSVIQTNFARTLEMISMTYQNERHSTQPPSLTLSEMNPNDNHDEHIPMNSPSDPYYLDDLTTPTSSPSTSTSRDKSTVTRVHI